MGLELHGARRLRLGASSPMLDELGKLAVEQPSEVRSGVGQRGYRLGVARPRGDDERSGRG
jgi:hypothetical protein